VRPGRETSMQYFSCSGGIGTDSTKSASGYVMPNLCFGIRWDLSVMLCFLVRPGHEMSMPIFHARVAGAVSIESETGHVTPNLCFCIWSDLRVK
jgi:hypothetical protein